MTEPPTTTIAGAPMSYEPSKVPPPANSTWSRIEQAREALDWSQRDLGGKALGNATGYSVIAGRNEWKSRTDIQDRIISCLVAEGFSETWLRAGVLPERVDGAPLPEPATNIAKLKLLARRLSRTEDEIVALWGDLVGSGPLEKLPEMVQRAAFAAAYLDGRTLEDVRKAVREAEKVLSRSAGLNDWLHQIRLQLDKIKPGSGTRPGLTLIPGKGQ